MNPIHAMAFALLLAATTDSSPASPANSTVTFGDTLGSIAYRVSGSTLGSATPPASTSTPPYTWPQPTPSPPTTMPSPPSPPAAQVANPVVPCGLHVQVAYKNFKNTCPRPTTSAPTTAPASPSPAAVAAGFWINQGTNFLPRPHPYIAPGEGLAGLPMYLEVRAPLAATFDDPTRLGTLAIHATAQVYVDWGDGTPTSGPFDNPGAPWPNGAITHYWDYDGTYRITVWEDWTATWTLDGSRGSLGGLQTSATIDHFRVGQLESVRNY